MPTRDPNVRLTRLCDGCGQIDDHPHHVVANAAGGTSMHHDCCAATGCETCAGVLEATGDKRGGELLKAITSGAVDHLTSGAVRRTTRKRG